MRIVFMGTPEFALPALDAVAAAHEVVAVYSQPDRPWGRGRETRPTPVKERALARGFEVRQPERLSDPEETARLIALAPDVIVVVAFGQILKRDVLILPRLGCINIHSSLLPRWRGAAPIHWAVLSGDAETGVTTQRIVEKLDAGEILLQTRTPIGERETSGELHDRLAIMGADLISLTLAGLETGTLTPRPQDEARVTYARKLSKDMEALRPREDDATALDRRIRGLQPWPGTAAAFRQPGGATARLRILAAEPLAGPAAPEIEPGRLDERQGTLMLGAAPGVDGARSALRILRVQPEGKREQDAAAFLNGLRGASERTRLPWDAT